MARTTTEPKPRTLAVRITDEDAAMLRKLAKSSGVSKGAVIRRLIREAASRQVRRRRSSKVM